MCGIFGIIRQKPRIEDMITGLQYLEYRGTDSFGIGYTEFDQPRTFKSIKSIQEEKNNILKIKPEKILIGHTRWSTSSSPSITDSHPIYGGQLYWDGYHKLNSGFIVHNGIIENADELKTELKNQLALFYTNTDTEIIAHLLCRKFDGAPLYFYKNLCKEETNILNHLIQMIRSSLNKLQGTYSCIFYNENFPNHLFLFNKNGSLFYSANGYIGSDSNIITQFAAQNTIFQVNDGDIVILKLEINGDLKNFYSSKKTGEVKLLSTIPTISDNFSIKENSEKITEEHLMLKEIKEQPKLIRDFSNKTKGEIENDLFFYNSIMLFGCGSSYNAALLSQKYFLEHFNTSCFVEYASEFSKFPLSPLFPLFIAITQSGETRDVISVMEQISKEKTICLTNNVSGLASKYAKKTINIDAGQELAVAATKSFTMQALNLYFMGFNHRFSQSYNKKYLYDSLNLLADSIESLFNDINIRQIAEEISKYQHMIYLGAGHNYPIALEGALKMKEVSYIHAEAMPAAEFKHGPIALIDNNTLSVFLLSCDSYRNNKIIGNIEQIKARGGKILLITYNSIKPEIFKKVDWVITFDSIINDLKPLVVNVILQLLSYYVAKAKKLPIDRPRHLAKAISVY